MNTLINPLIISTTTAIIQTTNALLPFTEKDAKLEEYHEKKSSISASDLFSLFTADIIKQDVIFTR